MMHGQQNINKIILKGIKDKLDIIMWPGANGSGQVVGSCNIRMNLQITQKAVNLTSWACISQRLSYM